MNKIATSVLLALLLVFAVTGNFYYCVPVIHYVTSNILTLVLIFAVALPMGTFGGEANSLIGNVTEDEPSCGRGVGRCPGKLCCSLHNECGNTTYHCNVDLGCKRRWGTCH